MQSVRMLSQVLAISPKKLGARREELERHAWESEKRTSKEIRELAARISIAKRMIESMEPGLKNVRKELDFFDTDSTPVASRQVCTSLNSLDSKGLGATWEILAAREALLDRSSSDLYLGVSDALHSAPEHVKFKKNDPNKAFIGIVGGTLIHTFAVPAVHPFVADFAIKTAAAIVGGIAAMGIIAYKRYRDALSKMDSLKKDMQNQVEAALSKASICSQGIDELISRLSLVVPEDVAAKASTELKFARGVAEIEK